MAKARKAKIIPPSSVIEPTEITPEKEKELLRHSSEGFQLIEWIYNFFTLHEPLMYMIYSKYKKLGVNFLWDFIFSFFAYLENGFFAKYLIKISFNVKDYHQKPCFGVFLKQTKNLLK